MTGHHSTFLLTHDGVELEYILGTAPSSLGAIVLCHPHPEHGGTMRAPLIGAIAKRAIESGVDVLRFNFRGVGESTGSYGGGLAEIEDVTAAVDFMRDRHTPLIGVAGWSFGAATALRWQAATGSDLTYVGIAPPVTSPLTPPLPLARELSPARRTIIVGRRDQLIDVDELETYAESIGAAFVPYDTADHFFVFRHERLADDVLSGFGI
jgi:uncharacterized protein